MTESTSTIMEQLQATREERKGQHSEAAARWEELSRWYRDYFNSPESHPIPSILAVTEEPEQ